MENQIFDAQMERLKLVIRKHTATDLADFFGVPESTVSAAVRRGKMPSSWLVILMRVKNVHPEWILTDTGPHAVIAQAVMTPPAKRQRTLSASSTISSTILPAFTSNV